MASKYELSKQKKPQCSIFSSDQLDGDSGYDLWKQAFSPVLNLELPEKNTAHTYSAKANFYLVGDSVFGPVSFDPTVYMRSRTSKVEGNDCFLLQLIISGGYGGYNGKHEVYADNGSVGFYDLGHNTMVSTKSSNCISLFISREQANNIFDKPERFSGTILPGSTRLARFVSAHMLNISRHIEQMNNAEAEKSIESILFSAASSFQSMKEGDDKVIHSDDIKMAQKERICAWIEANLNKPDLSLDLIIKNNFVSRATLYRLFNDCGGVRNYIHHRRLEHICRDINSIKLIGTSLSVIAKRWGYHNYPQFCRLFRDKYKCSPSNTREAFLDDLKSHGEAKYRVVPEFRDWFTHATQK